MSGFNRLQPDLPGENGGLILQLRKASTPRCIVEFYTRDGAYKIEQARIGAEGGNLLTLDAGSYNAPSAALLSCHTTKDIGATAGYFTITLPDRPIMREEFRNFGTSSRKHPDNQRWTDVLQADDLVVIRMQRPPDRMRVVMVGLLDKIPSRSRQATSNGTTRTITITGQDLGRLFLNYRIWYANNVPQYNVLRAALKGWQFLQPKAKFEGNNRAALIANVLDNLLFPSTKAAFTTDQQKDLAATSLLGYQLGRGLGTIPFNTTYFTQEGPVWQFLKQIADDPWHELFIDTIDMDALPNYFATDETPLGKTPGILYDGKQQGNFLIFREAPFEKEDIDGRTPARWGRLPVFEVEDRLIRSLEIGGGGEPYNFFHPKAEYGVYKGAEYQTLIRTYALDVESARQHGLRFFTPSFQGYITDGMTPYDVQRLAQKLYRLYRDNDRFLSGSVTIQGHPAPRIGCRFRHTDDDHRRWEYYIEKVAHAFDTFGEYDTQLEITRGEEIMSRDGKPPIFRRSPTASAQTLQTGWDAGGGSLA